VTHVEAVYEDGVFRPMKEVALPERQRVHLSIEPIRAEEAQAWLQRVRQRRQRLLEEHGCFPDGTADIAEDRRR
jgi:predicted DNA-binding antitoxin AbrB/MazE fold protein